VGINLSIKVKIDKTRMVTMEALLLIFRIMVINVSILIEAFLALKIVFLFRYRQPDSNMQSKRNTQFDKIQLFSTLFHLFAILIGILIFQNEVSSFEKIILVFVPLVMVSTIFGLWFFRYIFIYRKTKDDTNRPDLRLWIFFRSDAFIAAYCCAIIYFGYDEYKALFDNSVFIGLFSSFSVLLGCYVVFRYFQRMEISHLAQS